MRKVAAVLVVAALATLCVGDLAQAAMAGHETQDCFGPVCDQVVCRAAEPQALPAFHPLAVAPPQAVEGLIAPTPTPIGEILYSPDVFLDRPIAPLAPRSPPLAV